MGWKMGWKEGWKEGGSRGNFDIYWPSIYLAGSGNKQANRAPVYVIVA